MINVVPSTFSLEINWNSSVQDINNIQILDYKIKVIDSTTHKEVAHHTAVTRSRLLVKHLVRNRTYTVEVQARNEVGYGANANISANTLLAGKLNHGIKILLALPLISPPSYRPIYLTCRKNTSGYKPHRILESFRIENEYEYEIFFYACSQKKTPWKASFYFSPQQS